MFKLRVRLLILLLLLVLVYHHSHYYSFRYYGLSIMPQLERDVAAFCGYACSVR